MVAVPDPVTLVGLIAPHERSLGVVSAMDTVPENPLNPVTVIVTVIDVLTFELAGELAVTAKSWNLKVTMVEWLIVPLAPIIVTL